MGVVLQLPYGAQGGQVLQGRQPAQHVPVQLQVQAQHEGDHDVRLVHAEQMPHRLQMLRVGAEWVPRQHEARLPQQSVQPQGAPDGWLLVALHAQGVHRPQ